MMTEPTADPLSYVPSELAKFFHSFPHYDISFSPVSSDFNPDSKQYQESLLLIAALPVVWMLLWILIYMAYFCYFCVTCRRRNIEKSTKSVRPTRWCSFFFTILTILLLTAAIFGSELVGNGLKSAHSDISTISEQTDDAMLQSAVIKRAVDVLNEETATYLTNVFMRSGDLDENDRPTLIGHATILSDNMASASQYISEGLQEPMRLLETDSSQFSTISDEYETYRRIVSNSLSGYLIITAALSLCALGSKKKGFLLACVAISIFNIMLIWIGAGFYAGLAVATADLCMDPTAYITSSVSDDQISVRYYLECEPSVNPLHSTIVTIQDHLVEADKSLAAMEQRVDVIANEVIQNITNARQDLMEVKTDLLEFTSSVDCSISHRTYMSAVYDICETALVGEAAVLGCFTLSGMFLIILVFLIHAAARFNSNRRAYFEVESQDNDYQSRGENTRSDNPLYYRFSQISTNEDNTRVATTSVSTTQATAPPRSSPPPAYQNHKDFYSTYGNNGTLDSNTRVPAASNDLNRNSNTFRT